MVKVALPSHAWSSLVLPQVWGQIRLVLGICPRKIQGNVLFYRVPRDFHLKSLKQVRERSCRNVFPPSLLWGFVGFRLITSNRSIWGPELVLNLDPDHSSMAGWLNIRSLNLLENLRTSKLSKGAHIYLGTLPSLNPKSRILLQAQFTEMAEPNYPRESQQMHLTWEAYAR